MSPRARAAAASAVTALAFTGVLGWLHLAEPGLVDGDSYYHTRAAQQLAEHGVRKQFPQAAFSTWSDHYSDKDFLFHVLLIPFVRDEDALVRGGKWAALCGASLVLGGFTFTLTVLCIRFGAVWIALFMFSDAMLQIMLKTRPDLLAMTLFPFEVLCLLTSRWKTLGALSAAHTLGHSSFVLVPFLSLAHGVAHALLGLSWPRRGLVATVAGIGVATICHPYFPNNLSLTYDQVVEVARSVWGQRPDVPQEIFGRELVAMPVTVLLRLYYPVWLPLLAGLGLAFSARARKSLSLASLTLCNVAAGFAALSLLSARFATFFAGLAALAAGAVFNDLAGGRSLGALWRSGAGARAAAVLLAACLVSSCVLRGPLATRELMKNTLSPEVYRPAIAFLDEVAQPQDQVYHNFWQPFSWLYHVRPDGRYIVGLDPIFLYRADPERFRKMLRVYAGRSPDPYAVIAGDFGARWVFVENRRRTARLRASLRGEHRIVLRYADRYAEVYEVLPPRSGGRSDWDR